jgi:hypothetical protein
MRTKTWIGGARTACAFAAAAITLVAAGCGGGGSDNAAEAAPGSQPPAAQSKAEGAYQGSLSNGNDLAVLVLEDDTVWAMYQWNGYLVGFVQGAGQSRNGSFTVADARDYDLLNNNFTRGSLSASYVEGTSIQGTASASTGTVSFAATTAELAHVFNYAKPATLEAIAGTWPGFFGAGFDSATVNVSANGALSARTAQGCQISGSIAPRASGKNVYDLQIVFGPSPCALPGQSGKGIALITEPATGHRQLLAAVVNETRELGSTFVGTR